MVHINGHIRIAVPPEQVRPKGWLRVVGPLAGLLGGRMEHKIGTRLKQQLETGLNS